MIWPGPESSCQQKETYCCLTTRFGQLSILPLLRCQLSRYCDATVGIGNLGVDNHNVMAQFVIAQTLQLSRLESRLLESIAHREPLWQLYLLLWNKGLAICPRAPCQGPVLQKPSSSMPAICWRCHQTIRRNNSWASELAITQSCDGVSPSIFVCSCLQLPSAILMAASAMDGYGNTWIGMSYYKGSLVLMMAVVRRTDGRLFLLAPQSSLKPTQPSLIHEKEDLKQNMFSIQPIIPTGCSERESDLLSKEVPI